METSPELTILGTYLTIISPKHWLALCKKKDDEIAPAYRQVCACVVPVLDGF